MTDNPKNPNILFTTSLSANQQKKLDSLNFSYESIPFISFNFVDSGQWLNKAAHKTDAWIFTSKRAVKAIKPVLKNLSAPDHIFAVGPKTANRLKKAGLSSILPQEFNAEELSAEISTYDFNHVIHFCGNLKSEVLKKTLSKNDREVLDVEVYQTRYTSSKIEPQTYDGFVFMSPSAVESFHQKNTITKGADIFCIGPSTAKAIEAAGIHQYHTPKQSTFNSLAATIQKFYL